MNELRAFSGVNFVMGYHKLPNLRNYWETGSPSLSVNFVANVRTRKRFKENLGNLHFSNNEDVITWDHPAHDRAFNKRWMKDYLNEPFLRSMKPEVDESVDEHRIKYKSRRIMRQHIKNKPIKWGFWMWYRCTPKTGYLYEFDIYTGRKETTEFGLGESVMVQLKEKLNGSFCHIFLTIFSPHHRSWENLLTTHCMGPKAVTKNWKTHKEEISSRKETKELVHESIFTNEESYNRGDSDCLVSKDVIVALR